MSKVYKIKPLEIHDEPPGELEAWGIFGKYYAWSDDDFEFWIIKLNEQVIYEEDLRTEEECKQLIQTHYENLLKQHLEEVK